jgi:hypothetical protein
MRDSSRSDPNRSTFRIIRKTHAVVESLMISRAENEVLIEHCRQQLLESRRLIASTSTERLVTDEPTK